jgi:hypothetical protein
MYRRFPLTHEIIYGEFGAIERLNLKYALTLNLGLEIAIRRVQGLTFFFIRVS